MMLLSAPAEPIEIQVDGWGGTVVGVFVALVVGPFIPSILKALFGAEHRGLLHSWDEWRDARARRDAERQQAIRNAETAALQATIGTLEGEVTDYVARFEAIRDQLADAREEQAKVEEELQRTVQQQQQYIGMVTRWARRVILWAEENGYALPRSGWQPYFQWLEQQGGEHHPREPPGE